MSAARKFTATNFYIIQEELKNLGGLEIVDEAGGVATGHMTFVVAWMGNRNSLLNVDYRPEDK